MPTDWHLVGIFALFLVGYALILGHWCTRLLADVLIDESDRSLGALFDRPKLLGAVERTLYVVAILAGEGGFVVAWLALKAVGTGAWTRDASTKYPGDRHLYQRFLITSGVSLLFAIAAAASIEWTAPLDGAIGSTRLGAETHWQWAIWACVGVVALSLFLTLWWVDLRRREQKASEKAKA